MKLLVIGDACTDVYRYGSVSRLSPEAPVPVFTFLYEVEMPGMALNVAANLRALGAKVDFLVPGARAVKTRIIDERSKQHIVRIDEEIMVFPIQHDRIKANEYDAIVVADYGKGFVDENTLTFLNDSCTCPVYVDTKKNDLEKYDKLIFKINEVEYNNLKSEPDHLIVTLGSNGAFNRRTGARFPANPVAVTDVCGAGDTFLASLAFFHMWTKDLDRATQYAVRASSITVQHMGVYAPTWGEVWVNS